MIDGDPTQIGEVTGYYFLWMWIRSSSVYHRLGCDWSTAMKLSLCVREKKGIITSSCVFRKKLIVTNRMLLIWISTSAHFVFKSVFCVFYLCIFFFFLVFSCEAALQALYKKESLLLLVVCVCLRNVFVIHAPVQTVCFWSDRIIPERPVLKNGFVFV